ncbi:hypothetical protein [Chitiniphilus shinanonensis]|uniref:hypothetical protein n=2 Tax=Chitiniphilus shinanonensis TaxID=553088 RepID=UPI00036986CC|nr:hypothetical protein [Chitiniphilus shinanonensis]
MRQPIDLFLAAGQSARCYVERDAVCHVVSGVLRWTAGPRWLGELPFDDPCLLQAGMVRRQADAGWVTLYAETPVRLRCHGLSPVPARGRLRIGWRARLAGGWQGLAASLLWRRARPE